MKLLIAFSVFLVVVGFTTPEYGCNCLPANDESTRWGGNIMDWSELRGSFKIIEGRVEDQLGDAMNDALVEVFDKPEYLLCKWEENNPNGCISRPPKEQKRIAACKTGKDGKFCFHKIPDGNYELRVSKGSEWNVYQTFVRVKKSKNASAKKIKIDMSLGI